MKADGGALIASAPAGTAGPRVAGRYLLIVLSLAAAYFLAAKVGLALAFPSTPVTTTWPPSGVALAALVVAGVRVWPGVFLGALLTHVTSGEPSTVAAGVACGNTLAALLGAWVLRGFRFDAALERGRDALALIGVAIGTPAVSAGIATATLSLAGLLPAHAFAALRIWWMEGSLSVVMQAPLLLAWIHRPLPLWPVRRRSEFLLYLAAFAFVGLTIFAPPTPLPLGLFSRAYLVLPLLAWAGLRFGPRETLLGACLIQLFGVWGATHGIGPFESGVPDERLFGLATFLAVIGCTALLLGAVTAERANAQAAARNNTALLQTVLQHTPAVCYVKDRAGRFLAVNERFEQLSHLEPGSALGKTNHEIFPKETADRFDAMDQRVITSGRALTEEELVPQDDGLHTYISVKCPLSNEAGEAYAVMGISTDISELHEAQEALRRAHRDLEMRVSERTAELAAAVAETRAANAELERRTVELARRNRENETLLKEIHHRVKNNLQVISSLLNLQAQQLNEPHVQAFVEDSKARIRSMALVHEHLYVAHDLQSVAMDGYLRALVDWLVQAHAQVVGYRVSGGQISLPVDRAIPCGLVVNELVGNAFKHAFPDGRPGQIEVCLAEGADGGLELRVRDDGVGLPLAVECESSRSFGLRLVGMLAAQLDGTLETVHGAGTTFRLRFPRA